MKKIVKKLYNLLSPQERRSGYILLFMILVMAILDMVGVASIMPFMAVLAKPEVIQSNSYIVAAYNGLGFTNPDTFLFFLFYKN